MNLRDYIRDIPGFPEKGVTFKDITPVLLSSKAFNYAVDTIADGIKGVDVIVGLDARGFIFASAVAYKLKVPLVLVRKKGKLPHETISESYSLEYGENIFEIHKDSIHAGQKVAIVDDLLATGGSMRAACNLVERLGGEIAHVNFLIELVSLGGAKCLDTYEKQSLITYQ